MWVFTRKWVSSFTKEIRLLRFHNSIGKNATMRQIPNRGCSCKIRHYSAWIHRFKMWNTLNSYRFLRERCNSQSLISSGQLFYHNDTSMQLRASCAFCSAGEIRTPKAKIHLSLTKNPSAIRNVGAIRTRGHFNWVVPQTKFLTLLSHIWTAWKSTRSLARFS